MRKHLTVTRSVFLHKYESLWKVKQKQLNFISN